MTDWPIIMLTDHSKIQSFSRCHKIQEFQGLELNPMKFKAFQEIQGPVQTLPELTKPII